MQQLLGILSSMAWRRPKWWYVRLRTSPVM